MDHTPQDVIGLSSQSGEPPQTICPYAATSSFSLRASRLRFSSSCDGFATRGTCCRPSAASPPGVLSAVGRQRHPGVRLGQEVWSKAIPTHILPTVYCSFPLVSLLDTSTLVSAGFKFHSHVLMILSRQTLGLVFLVFPQRKSRKETSSLLPANSLNFQRL